MIGFENAYGRVEISQEYFSSLVGKAASECYGVADLIKSPIQGIKSVVSDPQDKGVHVKVKDGKLIIDIHIAVIYGTNISAVTRELIKNVNYKIETCTGFDVEKINVVVDGIKSEL